MRPITANQREKLHQLVALEAEYRVQDKAEHEAQQRQIKLIERLGQDLEKRRAELVEQDPRSRPGELSPRQIAERQIGEVETRLKDAKAELERIRERRKPRTAYLASLTNTIDTVLGYVRADRTEFGVAQ